MEAVRRISFPVEKRDGLGVINTFGFNTNSRGLIPRFSLPPPFLHIRFLIETFSPILPTLPNTRLSQSTFHPSLPSSPSSSHKQPSTPFNERLFNEEQKYPSISSFRRQRKRASLWRRRKQQEKQKSVPKKEGNALKSAIYTYTIYICTQEISVE